MENQGRSPLYLLERSEVGVVQLDRELKVVAMNEFARRVLPVDDKQPFNKTVLSFHPAPSQPKVQFLIDQAELPVNHPPAMAMIINIPERVLLIRLNRLADGAGTTTGYALVFHDITDAVARQEPEGQQTPVKRQLQKVPTVSQNQIVLVDADAIVFVRADGHYTWVHTAQGSSFCNLTIGDLVERLDPTIFMRVHRSYVANLTFAERILRDDGRISLRLRGDSHVLPVSRTSTSRLLAHLGLSDADAS